jgi:hypothetical protein
MVGLNVLREEKIKMQKPEAIYQIPMLKRCPEYSTRYLTLLLQNFTLSEKTAGHT